MLKSVSRIGSGRREEDPAKIPMIKHTMIVILPFTFSPEEISVDKVRHNDTASYSTRGQNNGLHAQVTQVACDLFVSTYGGAKREQQKADDPCGQIICDLYDSLVVLDEHTQDNPGCQE